MAYLGKTPSQAVRSRYYFTATGGETSLSGTDDNSNTLTFTDGNYVDVALNGVTLVAGTDYNTTTANTIGALTALVASDVVEVIVYDTFSVFGGNVKGDFDISNGNLTVDTDTLYVDSTNDRVGIGTSSPDTNLNIGFSGADDNNTFRIEGSNGSSERYAFDIEANGENAKTFFKVGSGGGAPSTKMTLTSTGNVGIGTSSPASTLHLSDSANNSQLTISSTDYNSINEITAGLGHLSIFANTTQQLGASYRYMNFGIGTSESMRIDSSGNVGIGTTSPSRKLSVDKGTGAGYVAEFKGTNTLSVYDSATDGIGIGSGAGDNLRLYAGDNYSNGITVDTNGKLGIGTSSPAAGLHIDNPNNAAIVAILDTDNSNSKIIFRNTSSTGNNIQIGADGTNLVSFTGGSERMRITSGGNVGIGTTSPSSDAIVKFLHINDATSAGLVLDGPEKYSIYSSSSSALVFRNEDTDESALAIYDNGRIGYKSESSNNIRSTTDIRQGASKIWGHVNQNGTQGIQDSYNLSSITDNGTGRTLFSIGNNMGNATYVVSGLNRDGGGYNDDTGMHLDTSTGMGAGSFEVFCHVGATGNDGIALVAVHGDLA